MIECFAYRGYPTENQKTEYTPAEELRFKTRLAYAARHSQQVRPSGFWTARYFTAQLASAGTDLGTSTPESITLWRLDRELARAKRHVTEVQDGD